MNETSMHLYDDNGVHIATRKNGELVADPKGQAIARTILIAVAIFAAVDVVIGLAVYAVLHNIFGGE